MYKMDNFEKVEKLVIKAGVSYEEAKRALEAANGDLLDAMILLEKKARRRLRTRAAILRSMRTRAATRR